MTTELNNIPLDDLVSDIEIGATYGGHDAYDRVMGKVLELVRRLKAAETTLVGKNMEVDNLNRELKYIRKSLVRLYDEAAR